jgi:hypothetical protein
MIATGEHSFPSEPRQVCRRVQTAPGSQSLSISLTLSRNLAMERANASAEAKALHADGACLSAGSRASLVRRRHLEARRCLYPPPSHPRRNLAGPLCARCRGISLGQAAIGPAPDTNCDRCPCQQGGPRHLGASHARRGLSSAATAGRLIGISGKRHSERQGEGGDGPSVGPTTEANPLRGDAHQARNPNGSFGSRQSIKASGIAARTGRTQTCNRHDSPKPKTPLTRGGRPHNSPPAGRQARTLLSRAAELSAASRRRRRGAILEGASQAPSIASKGERYRGGVIANPASGFC